MLCIHGVIITILYCSVGLVIDTPPQNATICAGDDVNITCELEHAAGIIPVWRINGKSFSGSDIMNSSMFGSPVVNNSTDFVLAVYSADENMNQTKFQCVTQSRPSVQSSVGTLTVMGKQFTYFYA